ncbi:MAG: hypothetical protein KJZ70_16140 [Bryobacterales bacterium]|nr:hypothetical protein [Bryobacterales bacterium]
MLSIISFALALAATAIAITSAHLGWRSIRRSRQRLEELAESICLLRVSQESMERNASDARRRLSESDIALAEVRTGVEELQSRFEDVESYAAVCVPQKPASSGLNINRRVEAVRLLKEGHSEEQVAAELAIALSEVRLIGHLERNAPKPAAKRGRRVA